MTDGAVDLTGRWSGFYNFPVALPPVPFEASISDSGGAITGTTVEPDERTGGSLHARLEGQRDGLSVRFVKMYDEQDDDYDFVHYAGTLCGGGSEIEGEWEIPGNWSGTFLMVRETRDEAKEERQVGEEIRA